MQRVFRFFKRLWAIRSGLAIVIFIVVVGFLDNHSIYRLISLYAKNSDLREQITYYEQRYEEDTKALELINSSPDAVVKVARVKHRMKKDNEDVYIVVEK
ncbi:septum formation initiator family protein [Alloprevotella sp. OH1205_COT-284]|uniref:FtsB family cell division protein n=1 Tax=Alloprevotella sp. OH1205_COT-284 TaxID=2491043 RepID=UPI000F5D7DA7|nr:septum formation initiator family protein [Alloprevotella sp. OH1205_COT-284]RRD80229.1 septum formation initiator family protein [Alloprevotella sp. OH1205_COT-284]